MENHRTHHPGTGGPTALMIRHAERDPIQNMADALMLLLTDRGRADSFELGRTLAPRGPFHIFHSPVPRCRETAESIARGIEHSDGSSTVVGPVPELGGPYITGAWDRIVAAIETLGHPRFIREWFDGRLPSGLIMPLAGAARIQLDILAGQLRGPAVSSIHVTHDWNIMIMREYYFHLRHEDIGEPGYLDGMSASLEEGSLRLRYHEHEAIVGPPDFRV